MRWSRCPRCNSGRVVQRSSGCLSKLALISLLFAAMSIFGMFMSGDFARSPFELIVPFVMAILIPVFFIFIYIKFGRSLFCRDCYYNFRTKKE